MVVPEVIRDSTHHHVAPDLAEGADEVSVVVVVHLSQRRRHAGHKAALQEGKRHGSVQSPSPQSCCCCCCFCWRAAPTHNGCIMMIIILQAASAADLINALNLKLSASLSTDTTDTDLIWQSLHSERQLRGIYLERDRERKAEAPAIKVGVNSSKTSSVLGVGLQTKCF